MTQKNSSTLLRLAVQKSGRLSEESLKLIEEAGIDLSLSRGSSRLKTVASNFPLEVLFLRDDDIPGYVSDGVADVGIIGENVLLEQRKDVSLMERLGFSRCRLAIAVPKGSTYSSLSSLAGKRIATSYPALLSAFLKRNELSAQIHEISGSVEIAPSIGLADAICDLVGSGSTLVSNGLQEVESVLDSEAVLIGNVVLSAEKNKIAEQLLFRIKSVLRAKHCKYILMNTPNDSLPAIFELLPGMKSPSVLPLATPGWSSVHSVVEEDDFWGKIERLKECGAEGILVVPIEKMIL